MIHELRPKGRGRIKNFLPHKTKQSSLPWNKARNGKKWQKILIFLSVFVLCFFFFRVFCVSFSSFFFVLLLPLILLLLLLLLNDQIANFFWAFTLFQGKEPWIRPLSFGLNSCMTQQNKGVSKTFYHIRKNRVPYLERKWKPQKNLQFDHLVVVKVVVV